MGVILLPLPLRMLLPSSLPITSALISGVNGVTFDSQPAPNWSQVPVDFVLLPPPSKMTDISHRDVFWIFLLSRSALAIAWHSMYPCVRSSCRLSPLPFSRPPSITVFPS